MQNEKTNETLSTGSSEFILFCNLMSIHSQLQNLNLGSNSNPDLALKLKKAHEDSIAVVSYMAQVITAHMAPHFANTQNFKENE